MNKFINRYIYLNQKIQIVSINRTFRNYKSIKEFSTLLDKKYYVGINLYDSAREIKIGIVDKEGNVIANEKINCGGLYFKDKDYLDHLLSKPKILDLISIEEIKLITINTNLNDELDVLIGLAVKNKFGILLADYEYAINNSPMFIRNVNLFPCINVVATENILTYSYHYDKTKVRKIGSSNIKLGYAMRTIKSFMKIFKNKYKTLSLLGFDNKIDEESTKKIIKFFDEEYLKFDNDSEYSIINFLNNFTLQISNIDLFHTDNRIIKKTYFLPFNNFEDTVYLSRLKSLFDEEMYIKPTGKRKEIIENHMFNEILESFKLYIEGLVTLINFNLYAHLLLFTVNKNIDIKSINLIGSIFDNPIMQKELEKFKEKFKIKSLKKFSESDCENLSLAFSGLEYSRLLGLDKFPDKYVVYKIKRQMNSVKETFDISELYKLN